jgi:polyhydroxyalkanoate synthase
VYKINLFAGGDVTFLLTNGGHNAGIVSEPRHDHRQYQMKAHPAGDPYVDPDTWAASAPHYPGSWWPAWRAWLVEHGTTKRVPPPQMGAQARGLPPLDSAPGRYVHMK